MHLQGRSNCVLLFCLTCYLLFEGEIDTLYLDHNAYLGLAHNRILTSFSFPSADMKVRNRAELLVFSTDNIRGPFSFVFKSCEK